MIVTGLHVLCFILVILNHKPAMTVGSQCVDLPPSPMNGKLTVHGRFHAWLICSDKNKDLPLNAPGDGGILTCDTASEGNYGLKGVAMPECLDIKRPSYVEMSIHLSYTTDNCSRTSSFESDLTRLRDKILISSQNVCEQALECKLSTPKIECATNKMYTHTGQATQVDITIRVVAEFSMNISEAMYLAVFQRLRDDIFHADDGLGVIEEMWGVTYGQLVYADVEGWKAICDPHPNTAGTNLVLHKVVSCRGCPRSFVFSRYNSKCEPCPFNYYTPFPFSSICSPCPPEAEWGIHRQQFLELCYARV